MKENHNDATYNLITTQLKDEARALVDKMFDEKFGKLASKAKQNGYNKCGISCSKVNSSNAGAGAMITGIIKDFTAADYLSPDMSYLSVDPNKIRRAKNNIMKKNTIIKAN